MVAFFACLYFAMLRPSEAAALAETLSSTGCWLGETRPGRHHLQSAGTGQTAARSTSNAGLKNRPRKATRPVPIPPELVAILRGHIARYGVTSDGRLFRSEGGGYLHPSSYSRTWQRTRQLGLSPSQVGSPLARRPYHLRHGGVSLRLNAGVPATQVAEWAGHSVEVLLTIYAKCIEGRDQLWFDRIDRALSGE